MNITLATLPQATAQEVFDQVATHLLKQNKKSLAEEGRACLYRGKGDMKCAAGCLIGEDEYGTDFEYNDWEQLYQNEIVPGTHFGLILALQKIHDNAETDLWEELLGNLADTNQLSKSVLSCPQNQN